MIKQNKKRKITRNEVFGSIQLAIGIFILLLSILGFFMVEGQYQDYSDSLQRSFNLLANETKTLKGETIPNWNYTKDTYFLMVIDQANEVNTMWADQNFKFAQLNFLLVILTLLAILFITQGIVNFGLDRK